MILVDATIMHLISPDEKLKEIKLLAQSIPCSPTDCFSKRPSKVCLKDLNITESNMASSSSKQGNTCTVLINSLVPTDSGVARPGPTRAYALPSTFQALPSAAKHDSRDSIKIRKYSSYSS